MPNYGGGSARKALTDRDRLAIALHTAAYMRWFETRKGNSPTAEMTHGFIAGALDDGGFDYDSDEPKKIEMLALTLDVDAVEAFISKTGALEDFDRAAQDSS